VTATLYSLIGGTCTITSTPTRAVGNPCPGGLVEQRGAMDADESRPWRQRHQRTALFHRNRLRAGDGFALGVDGFKSCLHLVSRGHSSDDGASDGRLQQGGGIGDVFAGDVGRRAVDGFEDGALRGQVGAGDQAELRGWGLLLPLSSSRCTARCIPVLSR